MENLTKAALLAIVFALLAWGLSALFKTPYDKMMLYMILGSYCTHVFKPGHD